MIINQNNDYSISDNMILDDTIIFIPWGGFKIQSNLVFHIIKQIKFQIFQKTDGQNISQARWMGPWDLLYNIIPHVVQLAIYSEGLSHILCSYYHFFKNRKYKTVGVKQIYISWS